MFDKKFSGMLNVKSKNFLLYCFKWNMAFNHNFCGSICKRKL